ncbi:clpX [Mytilus coruscus]|uniref:ClpX n=1 Tax=Mytilus coruscus TaxID=42192 RepID=A0A6J8BQW1_MYTCO|nr:clpX [Mytilus coruscus]
MSGSQCAVFKRSTEHVFCSSHNKETTFLCTECGQFICDRCVESVHAKHVLKSIPRTNNITHSDEMLKQHIQVYKEVWQVELEEQLNAIDIHAAKLVETINKLRDSYKEAVLKNNTKNKSILKEIEDESHNNIPPTLSLIQTTLTPSKIDILGIKREFGQLCSNETSVSLQPGFSWPSLYKVKQQG